EQRRSEDVGAARSSGGALPLLCCFSRGSAPRRDLHSFPTRRSSDLDSDLDGAAVEAREAVGEVRARLQAVPDEDRRPLRARTSRSEEHTSELQSLAYLVCRLLLEKKK